MPKRRTKVEVIKDLLEVLKENKKVKITHLIYKSNLSNNSIKPYLEDLKEKEMIAECVEKKKKHYEITDKGHEFLAEFERMKIFSEAYGL